MGRRSTGGAGPAEAGRDEAEAALREALRAADAAIEMPPGLWARIQESSRADGAPAVVPLSVKRRRSALFAVVVAAAVAVVALGVWWLVRPAAPEPGPSGPGTTVPIKVYNSEVACRGSRTLECALRLAKDPRAKYAAPDNAAGRVWHGDPLAARCVVTDGTLVRDEEGITSTRWYLVRTAEGVDGWLPGVRTRNTREVRTCTADDM